MWSVCTRSSWSCDPSSLQSSRNLSQLPNFALTVPLATFHEGRQTQQPQLLAEADEKVSAYTTMQCSGALLCDRLLYVYYTVYCMCLCIDMHISAHVLLCNMYIHTYVCLPLCTWLAPCNGVCLLYSLQLQTALCMYPMVSWECNTLFIHTYVHCTSTWMVQYAQPYSSCSVGTPPPSEQVLGSDGWWDCRVAPLHCKHHQVRAYAHTQGIGAVQGHTCTCILICMLSTVHLVCIFGLIPYSTAFYIQLYDAIVKVPVLIIPLHYSHGFACVTLWMWTFVHNQVLHPSPADVQYTAIPCESPPTIHPLSA